MCNTLNTRVRIAFLVILALCLNIKTYSGTIHFTSNLTGSQLGSGKIIELADDRYDYIIGNSGWSSESNDVRLANRVWLRYEDKENQYPGLEWSVEVPFQLERWDVHGTALPIQTGTLKIAISNNIITTVSTDQSVYVSEGGYKTRVTITGSPVLTGIMEIPKG